MKETKKKEISMEQKIYMALLGVGIAALAGLTLLYGFQSKKTGDLVEQNIELGEQNEVSGPVAATEDTEEDMVELEEENVTAKETLSSEVKNSGRAYNGKDRLSWPVDGNILIPYSMDTTVYFETLDQYQCNPALYMKAQVGTEVKAIYGGKVTAVEKSQRYGQMLTIDMGNGYEAIYGQLADVKAKKGDALEQGAVIGKIAEPTNYFLLEGSHLYLKMEKDKKPVNPTEYFAD